jgi:GTPase SAR1 family protein
MGIIQSLDVKKFSNFGDLAIFYLKHLSMLFQSAETIVDVFDRYDLKDSIKSAERERRSQAAGGHRIYHVNEGDTEQIYTVCNLITCYFFHDLWIPESPC